MQSEKNKDVKILVPYVDFEDEEQKESIWAEPVGDNKYKIANIPFFVSGLSYGDIVTATPVEDGLLAFDDIIEHSMHSTIYLIFTMYQMFIQSLLLGV
jgi:hypothetical protein